MPNTARNRYFFGLSLLFFFLPVLLLAQKKTKEQFAFSHLTVENGLANNWCFTTFHDSRGYIWIGTQDGLSRYDSYQFKNYQDYYEFGVDSLTIKGSSVMDIVEDQQGFLWIATVGGGVIRHNPETEAFKNYKPTEVIQPNENIMFVDLFLDSDSLLWIGTFDIGLLQFNLRTKEFKRFNLDNDFNSDQDIFRKNSIHEITADIQDDNILWIAANNGLYKFDKRAGEFTYFPVSLDGTPDYYLAVMDVHMQQANELWVAAWGEGISRFDLLTQSWTNFLPSSRRSAIDNIILDIESRQENELWLASQDQGLLLFNTNTKKFTLVSSDPTEEASILSNSVNGLDIDKDGRLWVLNYREGISILDPKLQFFQFTELTDPEFCPEGRMTAFSDFVVDQQTNRLFVVNSVCKALFIFDKNRTLIKRIPLTLESSGIPVYRLLLDHKRILWITVSGMPFKDNLLQYDLNKEELLSVEAPIFEQLPVPEFELTNIIQDSKKNIWIGTKAKGLIKIGPNLSSIKQFIRTEDKPSSIGAYAQISGLIEDSQGNIWISSLEDGLFMLNPKSEEIKHFDCYVCKKPNFGLFEKRINAVLEDKQGKIWVGTGDLGVQVLDPTLPDSQLTIAYRTEEGLPNEKISGLIRDQEDHIWIATQRGLCRYEAQTNSFIVYDQKDGLKSPFITNGFALGSDGHIFIGTQDGFYTLNPKEIQQHSSTSPILFTKFRIFEEEQVFPKNINYLEQIKLEPGQNFFSFEFTVLNPSQTRNNRYAYILEGFDKDWIYPSDNRNFAPYTNIPPGHYTFKVKAANSQGIWDSEPIALDIWVKAPWFLRWWAKMLFGIIIASILFSIYHFQMKRQYERQEAERLRELDGLKTRLYTNITHEFRTPLTVIMGMAETLRVSGNTQGQKAKEMILRNGKNLLSLVNQMLDLSKLESGNLKLHLRQANVIPYLQYLTESFESVAEIKKQQLIFYSEIDQLLMDYDEEYLKQILSNLLSNAIKFTPEQGKIILHCSAHNDSNKHLQIKVKDSGIGISEEALPHIFNRFYQVDNSTTRKGEGTGIGLALTKELIKMMGGKIEVKSTLGQGTEFLVLLPVHNTAPLSDTPQENRPLDSQISPVEASIPFEIPGEPDKMDSPVLLVIEDNPDVISYIHAILRADYTIQMARNGQEGIDKAIELVPDLIISDVMMPEKDGLEVCETLKNDQRTSHIPIILLTAKASTDDKIAGLSLGADAYLTKPFNKEELMIRIQKMVERNRQLQQQFAKVTTLVPEETEQKEARLAPTEEVPTDENEHTLEDAFLLKLQDIVEEKMEDPDLSIAHLCKAALLSHTQLYRKLKALTNQTPSQFIRAIRLKKAMELLKGSDLSISEIAYDLGFNDPNYFSRIFLKEFGQAPSALRKQL